jgi:hypothetical protein
MQNYSFQLNKPLIATVFYIFLETLKIIIVKEMNLYLSLLFY